MTTAPSFDTDVLVLGAGPVGLTLANELTRHGARVRIVDKLPAIRDISKAMIWHVRTQEALDRIGVLARGQAEAVPLREVSVRAYGKSIGSWHLEGVDSPYPHPLIIGQHRTQHLLADLLTERGVAIEWNSEAVALTLDDQGITATIQRTTAADPTQEMVRAQYIVGCEGSSSLVRRTTGMTFEGERYTGEQFIQADCRIAWALPSGRSYLFLTEAGYLMVIEMPGDLVRIFMSLPDASTPHDSGQQATAQSLGATEDMSHAPTLGEIHSNLTRLTGLTAELSAPVWLARYRTSHRYANTFRSGRAFVAGDSGHVHVPIGGQGMNTGIQDAFNLGWKLAGVVTGIYQPELLDTYNAERHPVAESLIHGTDMAYRTILNSGELQQRAARMFGPFLLRQEVVQRIVRNTLEEVTIAYANTPLNADQGGSSGPKPGERVLDARVVRWADKRTLALRDLTRGTHWTLLLFGGTLAAQPLAELRALALAITTRYTPHLQSYLVIADTAPPTEWTSDTTVLLDAEHDLHQRYGVSHPALYLLRPDDVVGFRGTERDRPALDAYLQRVFVERTRTVVAPAE